MIFFYGERDKNFLKQGEKVSIVYIKSIRKKKKKLGLSQKKDYICLEIKYYY